MSYATTTPIRGEQQWEQTRLRQIADTDAPLKNGRNLYSYQKEGVQELLSLKKAILAWDMGLGKTVTALVAAKAFWKLHRCPVIVLCPLGKVSDWLEEAAMVGVPIIAASHHHETIPAPPTRSYCLIVDEAHEFSNFSSLRTQRFLALATALPCRSVFLLTGTPLRNGQPENLCPLLQAVGHPAARSKQQYSARYKKGKNLDELHKAITQTYPVLLRRTKKQCLKDLPPKTRVLAKAEIAQPAMDEYHRMLTEFRRSYKEKIAAGLVSSQGEAIATLTKLRHAASKAKVQTAIALAQEALEQDSQVVIFGAFKDTQYLVARALKAEVLNGDTPQDQRANIVKRFQAGRQKVLVCAFGVAGVGITLTAADTVILIDRGWSPAENLQAEDRIHRISQTVPTTAVWVQAFEIDFRIDRVLQAKQDRINLILEGKRKTMRGAQGIDAREMLRTLMEESSEH